jgi:major vault protein
MAEERQRERDLILSPNEFAFISDQTKGNINVYVGPYKASLSNTDQPIIFNIHSKRFEKCSLEASIQTFAIAPEGWYLTLKNPTKDNSQPKTGTVSSHVDLNIGHKVNIPGPIAFPLWGGQMVYVVQGHHLRSNQYLIVRVYDEKAAQENWSKAVIKSQTEKEDNHPFEINKLTLGKLFIIKGTEVSFYIPPTGIEVVKDESDQYIRNAVTLERLEYCILLDENGNKRYVRGPEVVFTEPTEEFIEDENGNRKFRAIELSEIKGIYIKVIAPYSEGEVGTPNYKEFKEGDELFITGKDMMIYFPRREHAIIKYDNNNVHYAVAIPAGTARYSMNRLTGEVVLRRGPDMFLPDPRTEVIVRRILDVKQVALWFPANEKAKQINEELKKQASFGDREASFGLAAATVPKPQRHAETSFKDAEEKISGDSFDRKNQYTPPRTITLDTKYEGAVAIEIWTGYAIMVVGKFRDRKVIVGPATYLLEFDEYLEVFSLSTGNPKSDANLLKDVYLRVLNNKVSDTFEVETKDFVKVQFRLSYRLNFIDDSTKWFNVENYVRFLTDRFRSILSITAKNYGVEELYKNAYSIINSSVLGPDKSGYRFTENNVHIYDVEVFSVNILDASIAKIMVESEQSVIQQSTTIQKEKAKLETVRFLETIKQETALVQSKTQEVVLGLQKSEIENKTNVDFTRVELASKVKSKELESELAEQESTSHINNVKLEREKNQKNQDVFFREKNFEVYAKELEAQIKAISDKAKAITPDLISALQSFSDKELLQKVAEAMAPLAILGGDSVSDVFSKLLQGTKLEGVFLNIGNETLPKIIKKKEKD